MASTRGSGGRGTFTRARGLWLWPSGDQQGVSSPRLLVLATTPHTYRERTPMALMPTPTRVMALSELLSWPADRFDATPAS